MNKQRKHALSFVARTQTKFVSHFHQSFFFEEMKLFLQIYLVKDEEIKIGIIFC